jgi:hypothetical protein
MRTTVRPVGPDARFRAFYTAATSYARGRRNAAKREYTLAYRDYLLARAGGFPAVEPECGELSGMAAQAVRLNLYDLAQHAGVPNLP